MSKSGITKSNTAVLRADARRNRERLLAAARDVFLESGTDAPLDAIVRRAGLGSGTLYRHFATRDAVMRAVYRGEIEAVCGRAREIAKTASPGAALTEWLGLLAETTGGHGLAPALMGSMKEKPSKFIDACHDAIRTAALPLLHRAQEAGSVRGDVGLSDVLELTHAIASMPGGPDRARRMIELLMEGLRIYERTSG